ncbi:GNAT family N-acetyltransferase [Muricauda sp. SCSIO 64092]|uniref:GNAT family N-acetyltransferase n=1 Tax=Allomuricauda sp. SCSIO 64092 TaxID=2908842 RepID=UPI001FF1CC44|nr:GNAT family N-acetyltransferase [Muricauda sp. SCSIO 64092]UOY06817.1 GNAT family N-acetyltransferase [Muricauda sp. SCSIO 64092]
MKIEFKTYTDTDKPDVLEMMEAFHKIDGYDFDLTMGAKNLLDFTSNEMLGRLYLITHGKENIGYIVLSFGFSFEYNGRDAFIDELYIKRPFRSKGIGKLAMDFVESESKRININAVHLEVEPHNSKANQLYRGKGYKPNGRTLMTKRMTTTLADE